MHSKRIFDKSSKRKRKLLQHQNTSGNFQYNTASYCCGNVGFSPRGRKAEELISFVWLARLQYPKAVRHISCTHNQRLHFHCASLLTLSQILAKCHCYNKQLRTCHTDGPFRDILAAGLCSTTKILTFLSALKLRL